MINEQTQDDCCAPTTGASPIPDLDQCVCSGKNLARLLRPAILATLLHSPTHGYAVARQVSELGLYAAEPPDPSGIYRTLQEMEKEGLVTSAWELGDSGPAKRRYELLPEGLTCLQRWAATLKTYRANIDDLLALVSPQPASLQILDQKSCACRSGHSCCC